MSGSLGGILSIARTALLTHQRSVSIASNNIANANTEGYSRQRAELKSGMAVQYPYGSFGTGVQLVGVERARDVVLDRSVRDQTSLSAGFQQRFQALRPIEDVIAEPTEAGLSATLDAFWSAWGDLSNDPSSSGPRVQVQQAGRAVGDVFHRMESGFAEATSDGVAAIQVQIRELNQITSEVAEINKRIVDVEAGGIRANDLRDQRDLLTDKLAEMLPINVVERGNGSTGVYLDGTSIVDGAYSRPLTLASVAGQYQLQLPSGVQATTGVTGSLGATMDLVNNEIPALRQRVDALASAFVGSINTLHQTGTNPLGNTGVDFFDPAGTTARTIGLSSAVLADSQEISAGTPDGLGQYQAGQNDIALGMSQLRDGAQAALGGQTFSSFYGDFVIDVGLAVSDAQGSFQAHDTARLQAEGRRTEVSGVSVDEELVDLMRFQQAFEAAARLVNTADEMIQTVLGMV